MKIAVDENIPLMTVRTLCAMGHDVLDIRGTVDEGMQDDTLWHRVQYEERLLITTDKGFTRYRATQHHGVLIIRLRRPNRHKIHQRVMQGNDAIYRQGVARVIGGHAGRRSERLAHYRLTLTERSSRPCYAGG